MEYLDWTEITIFIILLILMINMLTLSFIDRIEIGKACDKYGFERTGILEVKCYQISQDGSLHEVEIKKVNGEWKPIK